MAAACGGLAGAPMYDLVLTFVAQSLVTLRGTTAELLWAGLFFLALGYAVKRGQLFGDIRGALPETRLNLQILLFNLIFVAPLIVLGSQALADVVDRHGLYLVAPGSWDALPMVVTMFIAVFVGDFVGYWRHRLEHTPLLWPSHAVHHSDEHMTWIALERFHPINRATTFVIDSGVLLLFGFPAEAVLANNLVRHYYGYFIHADLPWTYGPLGKVFVSPAMHRWHHAADVAAFDTNYATVFSVFDRAFGTFRVPGPCTSPLGVTDDMGKTWSAQMGYAFSARAYRRLFRRRKVAPTRTGG